eukprot:Gregarina_sp_Poly_1__9907@NODE_647_length_6971_cov_180_164253_g493_i0_p7_GENE_NODE_647_length_6971_cov_180_164253_g493_i0NODE_647_length_6971_cov_180_164253_g493_i0_p7_ORF_typecomplete_len107_score17_55_NODE_647_length_6971_cov_180_164253_g493_i066516971
MDILERIKNLNLSVADDLKVANLKVDKSQLPLALTTSQVSLLPDCHSITLWQLKKKLRNAKCLPITRILLPPQIQQIAKVDKLPNNLDTIVSGWQLRDDCMVWSYS